MTGESNKTGLDAAAKATWPTFEQIAARAYQIYIERGRQHGHDMDDWLQAEYELLQLPVDKLVKVKPAQAMTVRRSVIHVVRAALC